MRSDEEIKKNNFMYQIEKQILLLHIDCDTIASPWDYEKTVQWYMKEYGLDESDRKNMDIFYVDIKQDGMWIVLEEEDEDYESLQYLYYIKDFRELIRGSYSDKIGNIRLEEGELMKFITFENYCDKYLKSGRLMKEPEVIASSEY